MENVVKKTNVQSNYKRLIPYVEIFIIVLAAFIRIGIGQLLGAWFAVNSVHDDELLIKYANLSGHFLHPELQTLSKFIAFPLFLDFVHVTGLSYSMVLSLVWIITALLVMKMFKDLTGNKVVYLLVYLFVLFTPSAFDWYIGTRLYRNSIIIPFVLMTFTLLLMLVFKIVKCRQIKAKNIIFLSLAIGLVFSFSFYLKEDGIWLLACLLFTILVLIALVIFRYFKTKSGLKKNSSLISVLITLCIPIFVFIICTNIYKGINYHYFGVYETNTRTSGELGKFVENVYKVQSEDRTADIWAPYDAIQKTFDASETLSKHPELLDNIINTPWFGNIISNPIHGDFLTWVLRDALVNSGIWKSESYVNDFFHNVNSELDEALKNGTLEKDKKFQLVSSAGGRNLAEMWDLRHLMYLQYKIQIFLEGYEPGSRLPAASNLGVHEKATVLTNMNFIPLSDGALKVVESEQAFGTKIADGITSIYKFLNPLMCLLSMIGFIWALITQVSLFKKKRDYNQITVTILFIMFVLAGISLAYTFGISWFSSFLNREEYNLTFIKFYSVGLVPILILGELLGTYIFGKCLHTLLRKKSPNNLILKGVDHKSKDLESEVLTKRA